MCIVILAIAITAIALVTFVHEIVGEEFYVQDDAVWGGECDTEEEQEQDVCIGIGKKYEKGYAFGRQIDASLWCFSLPLAFIVSSPSKQKALLDLFRRIGRTFVAPAQQFGNSITPLTTQIASDPHGVGSTSMSDPVQGQIRMSMQVLVRFRDPQVNPQFG
ncbi:hypothetical protein WR25_12556 [Diploscapter pachys]|uniref:Uncharacterized protein n=1 Tax=Diploscapter pachys TaxID=2018661 RepID=A0A2A2JRE1_9BILA|nr:hypothetical protein WR25_12556 [Diploscapter pachys]